MEIRLATLNDWEKLSSFFNRIYREKHPLQKKVFWQWQYGDKEFGRSFVCLNEENEIIGHLGISFGGGYAWTLNLFIDKEHRGKGVSEKLHSLARKYGPLAVISASDRGMKMYERMGWERHQNLVRYVKINPSIKNPVFKNVCQEIKVDINDLLVFDTHYAKQPEIKCLMFPDNSRVTSNQKVGGLRVVDIENLTSLEVQAWQLGYLWMDYVVSHNDLIIDKLEENGWRLDKDSVVPWLLNPVVENSFSDIPFQTEGPLNENFIVHRSYSDFGRVGSL